jgi:hypothetical protein
MSSTPTFNIAQRRVPRVRSQDMADLCQCIVAEALASRRARAWAETRRFFAVPLAANASASEQALYDAFEVARQSQDLLQRLKALITESPRAGSPSWTALTPPLPAAVTLTAAEHRRLSARAVAIPPEHQAPLVVLRGTGPAGSPGGLAARPRLPP